MYIFYVQSINENQSISINFLITFLFKTYLVIHNNIAAMSKLVTEVYLLSQTKKKKTLNT